jgi:hypothetical protein
MFLVCLGQVYTNETAGTVECNLRLYITVRTWQHVFRD